MEKTEVRREARVARIVKIALPRELTSSENIELVREFVADNFICMGMCADVAVHDDGKGNPHAHILLSDRPVDINGFCRKKDRNWNSKLLIPKWREQWAKLQNREYEKKGLPHRVTHLSYEKQGIDREPTKHLGRRVIALEEKGIQTDRGNENREIEARNRAREYEHIRERRRERKRARSMEYEM